MQVQGSTSSRRAIERIQDKAVAKAVAVFVPAKQYVGMIARGERGGS